MLFLASLIQALEELLGKMGLESLNSPNSMVSFSPDLGEKAYEDEEKSSQEREIKPADLDGGIGGFGDEMDDRDDVFQEGISWEGQHLSKG